MDLTRFAQSVKKMSDPKFIERLIIDSVDENSEFLIDLIKGQIRYGVKGDGSRTLKYIEDESKFNPSKYYVKIKETPSKGFPYRNYENTGAFLNDMFAYSTDLDIYVGSENEKTSDIEGDEGPELFKLADENKPEFAKEWVPTFINKIRNELTK